MASYEEILTAMQSRYFEQTGFYADDASDLGIRLKVLAEQLAALSARTAELQAQVFPQTAAGGKLDYHAETRGLRRKAAAPARGTLRFTRESAAPSDCVIPAGVVCAVSGGDDGADLRYETTAQGTLRAGSTFADLPARAAGGGALTNAAPNAVTVMITPVQGISGVTNPTAFTGGADGESDEQLRARLLRSFAQLNNGTNAAFYYDFAMGFDGVASANVVPRANGKGTVSVTVAGRGAGVPDALVNEIRTGLAAVKEINVDVSVKSAQLKPVNLSLELAGKNGVDFESLKAACAARLAEYFAGLAVGQNLLLAGIAEALYHIDGLYNYKLTAPAADTQAGPSELFTLGNAAISRMAVVV